MLLCEEFQISNNVDKLFLPSSFTPSPMITTLQSQLQSTQEELHATKTELQETKMSQAQLKNDLEAQHYKKTQH